MVTPGVRCELVELVKYEDRKEEAFKKSMDGEEFTVIKIMY